ncbi:hypothetical protein DL765_004098 [Monosporascus sp. GIB2]|nr:hypothetical protein DL765_004098 [Monosporascus sp. GIB2]
MSESSTPVEENTGSGPNNGNLNTREIAVDKLAPSLREAAKGGHTELVEVLLKKHGHAPADKFLNAPDSDGCTALYHAAYMGRTKVVDLLLNQDKIDPKKASKKNWTPLRAALCNEEVDAADAAEAAELLLEHEDVKGTKALNGNWNVLNHASKSGHVHVVRLLLSDPNVVKEVDDDDGEGFKSLYLASEKGHPRVVKQLLKHGANPNALSRGQMTAIYAASTNNFPLVVDILLRNGADPKIWNKDGDTPLMTALTKGHAAVAQLLIDAIAKS